MNKKMQPCTRGNRHAWVFVTNRITTRISGNKGSVSSRGVYVCICGETKLGVPQ